jgi:phosphoglycolate phosphatase
VPYELAIFDYDGTLVDSFLWFTGVFEEVADRYGFPRLDRARLEEMRGLSAPELVRQLGVPAWKLPLIANHMRRLAARDHEAMTLFDGVPAMLRALAARGAAIAVVTSNAEDNVRRTLGPDLAPLVRFYECGAALFSKRRKLRHVLRSAGLRPSEALVIGDEIRDLEAARAEGLPFGAVAWGYTRMDALRAHAPEQTFARPADIVRCFSGLVS